MCVCVCVCVCVCTCVRVCATSVGLYVGVFTHTDTYDAWHGIQSITFQISRTSMLYGYKYNRQWRHSLLCLKNRITLYLKRNSILDSIINFPSDKRNSF